jgi:hypothetical protein
MAANLAWFIASHNIFGNKVLPMQATEVGLNLRRIFRVFSMESEGGERVRGKAWLTAPLKKLQELQCFSIRARWP